MACLQIYRELLSLTTFLRVHSNSKEVSYLSWQNTYPNLKTTCHIELKFFLWTKLPENLLLAKYLKSVNAPCAFKKSVDGGDGWHFSDIIFSRFISFTFRNYFTLCQIVLCIWMKIIFSVTIISGIKGHSKLPKNENIP